MGTAYIDMDKLLAEMVQTGRELCAMLGIHVCVVEPRQSFWQKLRMEIANRPKVF